MRAPRLPTVSISHAVLSTSRRTCSIFTRASEIQRWTTPWSMMARPERRPRRRAPAHHLQRALGHPDRPHRVVDAPRPEALLREPEALALLAEQVRGRHADVVVDDLGVAAVRPVVVAEQARRAHDVDARRVLGHQDHALAPVPLGVRVGHAHDDQQLAARRHRPRRPPLAPVDHVVVAVALDAGGDVRRVRGRDVGLGHRERRPDPPVEQRIQPARLLLRRAEQREQLHVPRVGRRAVERLRSHPRVAAGDLGQRRVLQVGQARRRARGSAAGTGSTGRARAPATLSSSITGGVPHGSSARSHLLAEARLRRVHALVHEREQPLAQLQRGGVEGEVHGSSGATRRGRASRGTPARPRARPATGARRCRSCSRARSASPCRRRGRGWRRAW